MRKGTSAEFNTQMVDGGLKKAADTTVEKVIRRSMRLADFPHLGPVVADWPDKSVDYRRLVAGKYLLDYDIDSDMVVVAAIMDGRKDPLTIINRLP